MQIVFIIIAIIAAIGFLLLGYLRVEALNQAAEKIDDPKLRVTGDKGVWVWIFCLLSAASLVSLIWFFGSFGKLYHYEGGFTLRSAAEWRITEGQTEEAGQNFAYTHVGEGGILQLAVVTLSEEDTKAKGVEIKYTRNTRISELKEARSHLKPDAKAAEKQLKADANAETKELKTTLKGQNAELKAALAANAEQLKINLANIKNTLKQDLADNSRKTREVWQKGWLLEENDGAEDALLYFTTLKSNRLYTAHVSSVAGELSRLSIKPVGFFRGVFDGCIIPGAALVAIFLDTIHPYKTINNGFTYLVGFILGCLILAAFAAWMVYIILMKNAREKWKQTWLLLTLTEKIAYIDSVANAVLCGIDYEIKWAEDDFKSLEKEYESSPEDAFSIFNKDVEDAQEDKKKVLNKVGGFLGDVFTAGNLSRKSAEEEYNRLAGVVEYFNARYEVSQKGVKKTNTEYHWLRKKALLCIMQIKYFIEKLPIEVKEEFDQAEKLALDTSIADAVGEDMVLLTNEIMQFNTDYKIKAEAAFDRTLEFSSGMLEQSFSFFNRTNANGKVSDEDAAAGVFFAGLAVAAVVVEGAVQYFGAVSKNNEIKARLKSGLIKLRDSITQIESNRTTADGFIQRAEQVNKVLSKSFAPYTKMFDELEKIVFPEGDDSKTKASRTATQDSGGLYYTPEESEKIRALGRFSKHMKQIVEADL
jgi:gas vesicle protein